jgi:hypothetical protein
MIEPNRQRLAPSAHLPGVRDRLTRDKPIHLGCLTRPLLVRFLARLGTRMVPFDEQLAEEWELIEVLFHKIHP